MKKPDAYMEPGDGEFFGPEVIFVEGKPPHDGWKQVNILSHETYLKLVEFLESLVNDGEHGVGLELLMELEK